MLVRRRRQRAEAVVPEDVVEDLGEVREPGRPAGSEFLPQPGADDLEGRWIDAGVASPQDVDEFAGARGEGVLGVTDRPADRLAGGARPERPEREASRGPGGEPRPLQDVHEPAEVLGADGDEQPQREGRRCLGQVVEQPAAVSLPPPVLRKEQVGVVDGGEDGHRVAMAVGAHVPAEQSRDRGAGDPGR